jgi:hypothetical protein
MTVWGLLFLYIAFRLKQFTCDFILQSDWMALTKGEKGEEGYRALFSHAATHAGGTLVIVLLMAPALWWLAVVDLLVHGAIDRLKGLVTARNGWTPRDRMFWWSFGLDQEAHNYTHLLYVVLITLYLGGLTL